MPDKPNKRALEIANRLLLLRVRLYDNASDMARSVKLSPQRWYNYETGRRVLDFDTAALIVEEHGVDYNWLIGGSIEGLAPKLRNLLTGSAENAVADALEKKRARSKKLSKRKRRTRARKTSDNDNNGAEPHR